MLTSADGATIASVGDAKVGDRLRVRLRDGSLDALIESVELGGGADERG